MEKLWLENELNKTFCELYNKNYSIKTIISYTFLRGSAILALLEGFYSVGGQHRWMRLPEWLLEYKDTRPPKRYNNCSKVAIIIPTIDLHSLTLLKTLKIISSIGNVYVVGQFKKLDFKNINKLNNVTLYNVEGRDSPAISRNIGIELALDWGADAVLFLDDDVVLDSRDKILLNTLIREACNRGLSHPKAVSVGSTPFDAFHDYEGTLNGLYYGDKFRLLYATTFALAVDSRLLTAGLRFDTDFHTSAGEDIDFSMKAIKMGGYIFPADNVVLRHDYNYHNFKSINKFC